MWSFSLYYYIKINKDSGKPGGKECEKKKKIEKDIAAITALLELYIY